MRHESFRTCSKFLITRERAKPRFRAKIGDFRANPAREPTGRVAGLTHEGTAFVFLCGRCQSCGVRSPSCSVSVASCARCQSRCAQSPRREESRVIASSVVSRRLSPRREESRVIRRLSSCTSRVVCRSHRVVRSLASLHRLSSRVVCPLVVRRPAARCQSRRVRSLASLLCLSALCAVTASSGVSRHQVVCRPASCVISSCVVPLLGVRRVVRSACESRPFFLFRPDG